MAASDKWDGLTDRAKQVLDLAHKESARMNHGYIGTEHLLMGLLLESRGVAAIMLTEAGVDADKVRKDIENTKPGTDDWIILGSFQVTPACKNVMAEARQKASAVGDEFIGTEHMLLGLIAQDRCFGAKLIEAQGVGLNALEYRIYKVLEANWGKVTQVSPTDFYWRIYARLEV